jgi:hypothetical protein
VANEFPNSYKDPLYAALDAKTEQKLGLPTGLLSSIRLYGERSNHDQSPTSTSAKSPYQFIPDTRNAIVKKYGIDPLLSPENASEAAGLLLKEGLDRNKGDASQAVGEYIGGTDRNNWGRTTKAYINRVMSALPGVASASSIPETTMPGRTAPGQSTFDRVSASMDKPEPSAMATVFKAYQSGQMTPEDAKTFEGEVNAGRVMLPQGSQLNPPSPNWGNRPDGTAKGNGFLGALARPDGGVSTEISIGVNIGGKDLDIPTLVPTLTQAERDQLLSLKDDQKMPESIVQKAVDHAKSRISQGLPVFAGPGESPRQKASGGAPAMPDALAKAYQSGQMDPADKAQLDELIKTGVVAAPKGASQIPGQTEGAPSNVAQRQADPSLGQQIVGAGETALNLGTGMATGAVAPFVGIANALTTPDASKGNLQGASDAAGQFSQDYTYAPRTEAGQAQSQAVGNAMANAVPLAGISGEMAALSRPGVKPTAAAIPPVVRNTVGAAAENVVQGVKAIPEKVSQIVGGEPSAPATPTPGTMRSVGAAGVDMATQRRMAAQELPVPIELTQGQATRDFAQQRFEGETAKAPEAGAPLRDRYTQQNERVLKNMDVFFDSTGATSPELRATGVVVDKALVEQAKRDKTEVNVKYSKARKSEEAKAPVDHALEVTIGEGDDARTTTPLAYINEQPTGLPSTAVPDAARQYAVRLGVADLVDGQLVPKPTTIANMEAWRKSINESTGFEPVDIRHSAILKKLIDGQTEPVAGPLYRDARNTRARYAENYENRATIAKLLNNKRGTADRQVAFEDVFAHSVLNGSLDDVRNVRRILQRGGEDGQQAWNELQGQTINHIKEQATRNVARDQAGNQIISPAGMDRAVKQLDADGKLDFIFGKKGAEQIRTLNDVTNHIKTVAPGAVNTSNTASVLLAAMDMAISGAGGMPLPVMSGLRLVANNVKDRRLRMRVAEALGDAKRKEAAQPKPIEGVTKKTVH